MWQNNSHTNPRFILGIPGLLEFWFAEETMDFITFVLHKEAIDPVADV